MIASSNLFGVFILRSICIPSKVQKILINLNYKYYFVTLMALQAIANDMGQDIALVEQAMLDYFPEAISL